MDKNIVNQVSTAVVQTPVRRKITALAQGKQRVDFESNAVTWGELKTELVERGYDFSGVRVCEGFSQVDLQEDGAILPTLIPHKGAFTNDLVIVMTDVGRKIKSGSMSYSQMKSEIKQLREAFPAAREFFGNYTQLSKVRMEEMLNDWNENVIPVSTKGKKISKKAVKKTTKKVVKQIAVVPAVPCVCSCTKVDAEAFFAAVNLIATGVNILRTNVLSVASTLTDEELEQMVNKLN